MSTVLADYDDNISNPGQFYAAAATAKNAGKGTVEKGTSQVSQGLITIV